MAFRTVLFVAFLSASCLAQSTVTETSTLAIVIYPPTGSALSTAVPTTLSYAATPTPTSSSSVSLPPYTGQALLVGGCAVPQYTSVPFSSGDSLEVPMVGCSDDRLECCPSLSPPGNSEEASSAVSSSTSGSISATGIVSRLNASPLSVCPSDFVDIDPVCCPSGFSIYPHANVGGTLCYSELSTIITVPPTVLASISSAVAQTAATATSSGAAPTVSVIINQVFAIGLPCADGEATGFSALSTGAKVGIGVGAGVLGLAAIAGVWWCCAAVRRRREKKSAHDVLVQQQRNQQEKHLLSPQQQQHQQHQQQQHQLQQQQPPPQLYATPFGAGYSTVGEQKPLSSAETTLLGSVPSPAFSTTGSSLSSPPPQQYGFAVGGQQPIQYGPHASGGGYYPAGMIPTMPQQQQQQQQGYYPPGGAWQSPSQTPYPQQQQQPPVYGIHHFQEQSPLQQQQQQQQYQTVPQPAAHEAQSRDVRELEGSIPALSAYQMQKGRNN